jgi:hypothetical protein
LIPQPTTRSRRSSGPTAKNCERSGSDWTYPRQDVELRLSTAHGSGRASRHLEREGWRGHSLQLHTLAGTYIETADHLFPDRETIDQVPVRRFVTSAWVLHLPLKGPLETITADELRQAADSLPIRPGDACSGPGMNQEYLNEMKSNKWRSIMRFNFKGDTNELNDGIRILAEDLHFESATDGFPVFVKHIYSGPLKVEKGLI